MLELMLTLMIPQANLTFITACLSLILYLRIYGKAVEQSWKEFAEYFGLTLIWAKSGPRITGFYKNFPYKLYLFSRRLSEKNKNYIWTGAKIRLTEKTDIHLEIYPEWHPLNRGKLEKGDKFVIKSNKPLYSYQVLTEDLCQLLEEGHVSLFIKKREIKLEQPGYITDIDYLYMISEILCDLAKKIEQIRPVGEDCRLFNRPNYILNSICSGCKKEVRAGYYYCHYCGTSI